MQGRKHEINGAGVSHLRKDSFAARHMQTNAKDAHREWCIICKTCYRGQPRHSKASKQNLRKGKAPEAWRALEADETRCDFFPSGSRARARLT